MSFYGDADTAAELAGTDVSVSDLTDSMKNSVNNWINLKLRIYGGFSESDTVTEYYDMDDSGITELMLNNCPIIDGSLTIYDNAQSDNIIQVNSNCYYVDLETGIIQLLTNKTLSGTDVITAFTKGTKSVKVTYKYGYSAVPDLIAHLANLVLAKWGKLNVQQAEADGLKSVKIGDYSESYDLSFLNIESEFDSMIKDTLYECKIKYRKVV